MSDRFSSSGASNHSKAAGNGGAHYSPAGGGAAAVDMSGLTVRQVLALQLLLQGGYVTSAAKRAGVSRGTVHRWIRRDSRFFSVLQESRKVRLTPEARIKVFATLGRTWQALRDAVATNDHREWATVLHILGLRD
jgi:transposase